MTLQKTRAIAESVVSARQRADDERRYFLCGGELFVPADLPDELHPNDRGNATIAERFRTPAFGPSGPFAE
jgi:hypothetical protein